MRLDIPLHGEIEFEDAGDGPVVVLLHAFPVGRKMWRPQIDALQGNYRVIVPSLRGFDGSAPWDCKPSIGRMADDVRALLDELHIGQTVALCGLSMGGYTALAFARMFPRRLGALILADTRAEADDDAVKTKRNENISFARENTARNFIDRILPNMLSENTRATKPEVVREITQMASAQSPDSIIAALQALRDRHAGVRELPGISVPTLVIVGSDDTVTPLSASQTLAREIDGAQLEVIDNAGHFSNLEQPEAFNSALLKFLRGVPA